MLLEDLDKYLDKEINAINESNTVSSLSLSAIFQKYYHKFETIRLSYKNNLDSRDLNFSCYSKKIQNILSTAGKFQKNGMPISEFHIKTQLNREKTRRKNKGLSDPAANNSDTPSTQNDNQRVVLSPTADLNSSGVVKVSPKNNKKVVALNNGEIKPIKIDNMAKAIHILRGEIQLYKKDSSIPIWNGNDEFQFLEYKRLADLHRVKIFQLGIKRLLVPMFNPEIEEYYELWCSKAKICEKVFNS